MTYYNRQGHAITLEEWQRLFADPACRNVAFTTIGDSRVSTVWLGIDHNFAEIGHPIIFETMTFNGTETGECDRYATEQAALNGHAAAVAALTANR